MWKVSFLFYLSILCLISVSCGRKTNSIKDFRIALLNGTTEDRAKIKSLVNTFNIKTGFTALNLVEPSESYNSEIHIVDGLTKKNPGKVGFGQWFSETESKGACPVCVPQEETTTYTMKIEFDGDFFRKRSTSTAAADQAELFTLFAHEAGHGVMLNHAEQNSKDVMYPEITCLNRNTTDCGKNLDSHFAQVRSFWAN